MNTKRTLGYTVFAFALFAGSAILATSAQAAAPTASTGPAAGTARPISTTGLTQYVGAGGFTAYTNQTSGTISYSVSNVSSTTSGTITIGGSGS